MGWFLNNFPTIARLIGGGNKSGSRAKQTPERGRRRARSAQPQQPEIGESAATIGNGPPVGVAEEQAPSGAQPQPSDAARNEAAAAVESQPAAVSPVPAVSPAPAAPEPASMQSGAGEAGGGAVPVQPSEDDGVCIGREAQIEQGQSVFG